MASITRFHVSWVLTSALPEAVEGDGATPSISCEVSYTHVFKNASTIGEGWLKPWGTYVTGHKYWAALLGSGYSTADAHSAWIKQVPLWDTGGFVPSTNLAGITVTCERYLYPSGVGIVVTATFEGDIDLNAATDLHRQLTQDPVFVASDGRRRRINAVLAYELGQLEQRVLGAANINPVRGVRPTMVTTIAGATGETSNEDASTWLKQLCYPGQPVVGATQVHAARVGNFAETIRVSGQNAQASWSPIRSTTRTGIDGLTCYHHNLVLAALHIAQLLNLADLAGDRPDAAVDHARQLYIRAGTILGWAYGGISFYSTPFTYAAIDESHLVNRINTIRHSSDQEPIHRRNL